MAAHRYRPGDAVLPGDTLIHPDDDPASPGARRVFFLGELGGWWAPVVEVRTKTYRDLTRVPGDAVAGWRWGEPQPRSRAAVIRGGHAPHGVEICPTCQGDGHEEGETDPCPTCDGNGVRDIMLDALVAVLNAADLAMDELARLRHHDEPTAELARKLSAALAETHHRAASADTLARFFWPEATEGNA